MTGGAAHSNAQEKRDESRGSLLDCRERDMEGKGGKSETEETKETKETR